MTDPERGTTSLKEGEPHPAAHGALAYLNALSFEQRQDFLLTFSSLAIEGNRLAEVCYGTLRRLIDGEPVSDRYLLGLAWEIKSLRDEAMIGDPSRPNLDRPVNEATPIEARRALVKQIARQVLDLCRAHARDEVDEATTLGVLQSWLSDFARDTGEIRERWKLAKETRTGADLIAAFQASPHRDIDIEPERYHERGAKPKP